MSGKAIALCCLVALTGCAWMHRRPVAPLGPRLTSFDDLLPGGVSALLYMPDLPRSKRRFGETELASRLRGQELRGLWRKVEFLRPWVGAAYEQTTDHVDEFAWGRYHRDGGAQWFFLARLNQPAPIVLRRLHNRVLPRVSDEIPTIELVRERFRFRRYYCWSSGVGAGRKTVAAYALVGSLFVMSSDVELVRHAIARRPVWWQFRAGEADDFEAMRWNELEIIAGDYRPADDAFAWFKVAPNSLPEEETPRSRLERFAARLREIAAERIETVSAGLQFTPPEITGRWRLAFARPPRDGAGKASAPFDFAALVPDSALTFIAIHHLPLDHPLFDELREILGEALAPAASGRLGDLIGVLKLVPGIAELAQVLTNIEGRLAYSSLPVDDGASRDRCLFIALENPLAVAATFRFVPSFAKRILEKGTYRGVPYLHLKVPLPWSADGILLFVLRGALAITVHEPIFWQVVNDDRAGQTLATLPIVKRFRPFPDGSLLAEFYTISGNDGRADTATDTEGQFPLEKLLENLFNDRRLDDLVAGRAYSLCVQHPRGVEIVTSSATGFHWSLPTVGLAAIAVHELPLGDLAAVKFRELLRRDPSGAAADGTPGSEDE